MLKRLRPSNGETIEVKVKGLELPLLLRRSTRARRFSLQVSEARRGAILTMPVYSSFAEADEFLSRHLDWLKERVAGLSEPVPFTHGAIVPLRGYAHLIRFAGPVRQRGVVWLEEADDTKVARNGIVRGNTVLRANEQGGGYAGGIYVDGGKDILIERNVVSGSDLGIEIGAENSGIITSGVIVRDNVVYANEKVGIVFGGIAFDDSPFEPFAFLLSQLPMYFAMSALFFSSIIMCPLPGRPTFSISTYSVLTPAWLSHLARQWSYTR